MGGFVDGKTTDMLVDEQDSNILSLLGELLKGALDGGLLRLCVDDEVVLLAVRRVGDVLLCPIRISQPFLLVFQLSVYIPSSSLLLFIWHVKES